MNHRKTYGLSILLGAQRRCPTCLVLQTSQYLRLQASRPTRTGIHLSEDAGLGGSKHLTLTGPSVASGQGSLEHLEQT